MPKKISSLGVLKGFFLFSVLLFYSLVIHYYYALKMPIIADQMLLPIPYILIVSVLYLLSFKVLRIRSFGYSLSLSILLGIVYIIFLSYPLLNIYRINTRTLTYAKHFVSLLFEELMLISALQSFKSNFFIKNLKKQLLVILLATLAFMTIFSTGELSKSLFFLVLFLINIMILILGLIHYYIIGRFRNKSLIFVRLLCFFFFALSFSLVEVINRLEYLYVVGVISLITLYLIPAATDKL